MKRSIVFLILSALFFTSCENGSRLNYIHPEISLSIYEENKEEHYRLKKGDHLWVEKSSSDNGSIAAFDQRAFINTYVVNQEGMIGLPFGAVPVEGMTMREAEVKIVKAAGGHADPLKIAYAGFEVTILGEVSRPGTMIVSGFENALSRIVYKENIVTEVSDLKRLKVIRKDGTRYRMLQYDLTNADFLNSKDDRLYPGDVIYVEPMMTAF